MLLAMPGNSTWKLRQFAGNARPAKRKPYSVRRPWSIPCLPTKIVQVGKKFAGNARQAPLDIEAMPALPSQKLDPRSQPLDV
jgi:hypothetical protein